MSTEEIIYAWKHEQPGNKPARALHSTKEPEQESDNAPANPAGGQELSDEDLALAEGGIVEPRTVPYTCPDPL